jgi:hypothetical protein
MSNSQAHTRARAPSGCDYAGVDQQDRMMVSIFTLKTPEPDLLAGLGQYIRDAHPRMGLARVGDRLEVSLGEPPTWLRIERGYLLVFVLMFTKPEMYRLELADPALLDKFDRIVLEVEERAAKEPVVHA